MWTAPGSSDADARPLAMQHCTQAPSVCLQGNVKEAQYDVDFFRGFDLVLNGLDNLEARRHVNRLCLAAETPLVESGTTGYLGQVGSSSRHISTNAK